jgi:predicted MFS family arabinose efflux permease
VFLWGLDHRSVVAAAGLAGLFYGVSTLLPGGLMRLRRGLPTAVAMRGLLLGAMSGTEAFIPLVLTSRYGFSPALAGIMLTAGALGWSAGSWWQGRFPGPSRVRFAVVGAGLHAVGIGAVALSFPFSGWLILPAWIVAGLGIGLAYPALSVQVLSLSPESAQGTNSSAMQISDTLGASLAVGLAGALVNASGLNAGVLCMTVVALVAALAAPRVRNPHA